VAAAIHVSEIARCSQATGAEDATDMGMGVMRRHDRDPKSERHFAGSVRAIQGASARS